MKYIDADRLKAEIEKGTPDKVVLLVYRDIILSLIDSLQQEQPNDVRAEIKEYYGEDLAFEDERTKAAYHFFSAGKAFELREYEEEREKHITDLLDNFQKGMNAGYEKAISELKEGKVECSPVMKELIDKLFGIGNTFNFGFGQKNIQQEQSDKESLNESQQEFVDIVTERMLKEGPIPTLKGKQKAEFEKEFNRFKQIAGMVNWPAYEEIYKKIILWFMAWSADNFPNLNKVTDSDKLDFQQEQPEVDLCADIEMEWDSFNKHLNESGEESEDVVWLNWNSFADVARYFYQLGLKAK